MVLSVQIHQSYVPISQVVVAHKHRGKNGVYIHIYIYIVIIIVIIVIYYIITYIYIRQSLITSIAIMQYKGNRLRCFDSQVAGKRETEGT